MSSNDNPDTQKNKTPFSRRGFLQGVGVGGGAVGVGLLTPEEVAAQETQAGVVSGTTPITLTINGKQHKATVEPRVTLLDLLRNNLDMTGAKRVCDRASCGACTVVVDGKAVYSCTMLAVDVQGHKIETIEGLSDGTKHHPIIEAFVNNDAQQCGYCTPGFVMASKNFLDRTPNPTMDQVKEGLGGNLCRCGTYVGIRKAVLEAAGRVRGGRNA
ncbi:MAG TPA: (2Fe-2S)-binding protein [Bryobacteraceae bacterium]|nr:(2Fe-2S)-binding protein [Bryobacteraceae bacterium]